MDWESILEGKLTGSTGIGDIRGDLSMWVVPSSRIGKTGSCQWGGGRMEKRGGHSLGQKHREVCFGHMKFEKPIGHPKIKKPG